MTVHMYDDSSGSSDSSDEDLLDEIFVHSMFPDNKHDYSRANIEDLSKSQYEAMFRQVVGRFLPSRMHILVVLPLLQLLT